MGGEKPAVAAHVRAQLGSPPHGRGKDPVGVLLCPHDRITPAWAGKSPLVTRLYALAEDHPRMGGEKDAVDHQKI